MVTCNIGGYDNPRLPVKQTVDADYICYTENNLPYPLSNLSNKMKARYLKAQMHRYLDHDIFIWIDGRVHITHDCFVEQMAEKLHGVDIVLMKHPERKDIMEEVDYVLHHMNNGSEYLINRYKDQQIEKDRDFFVDSGAGYINPLYASGVFARRNISSSNMIHDDWWQSQIEFSCFDQPWMNYIIWKYKLNVNPIEYFNGLFHIAQHAQGFNNG